VTEGGSSVPRRQLGRYLKAAREESGLSLEAAARRLEWSKAKIYRIEAGQAALRTHDVIAMCSVYGSSAELQEVLVGLATETKARGWWHSYGDAIPSWFELYVGLEEAARRLRHYEPTIVPGLFQVASYAAAVIRATPGHDEQDVERLTALRMERKLLLSRRSPLPPKVDVILDEAVLRRPINDREGMRDQLLHLARTSTAPHTRIHILPMVTGPHAASASGAFVILDFQAVGVRQPEPTTIYSESLTGALYLDKPAEVEVYEQTWSLLEDLVLDAGESKKLVETIAKEYDDA
jgi:transcriptional regulator with XRE-family HTH domain